MFRAELRAPSAAPETKVHIERQLAELFITTDPVERSGEFDPAEKAIAAHDRASGS